MIAEGRVGWARAKLDERCITNGKPCPHGGGYSYCFTRLTIHSYLDYCYQCETSYDVSSLVNGIVGSSDHIKAGYEQ